MDLDRSFFSLDSTAAEADAPVHPALAGPDPDRGVLERVARGDTESFAVLVERHEQRLFRLCQRMVGDAEEARELTQDTFLRAFRSAAGYEPRARVYTWLYRIAVNLCLNRLRRRRIARFFSFSELGEREEGSGRVREMDPADDAPGSDRRLADRQRWRRAREAIDSLPSNQRSVVVLTKLEGLSYREVAEVLGISEGAVESRLVRAMRKLVRAREQSS